MKVSLKQIQAYIYRNKINICYCIRTKLKEKNYKHDLYLHMSLNIKIVTQVSFR